MLSLPYAFQVWGYVYASIFEVIVLQLLHRILLFVLGMLLIIYGSSALLMPKFVGPIVLMLTIWPSVGNPGYFSGPTDLWRRISEWKSMIKLPSFPGTHEGENGTVV